MSRVMSKEDVINGAVESFVEEVRGLIHQWLDSAYEDGWKAGYDEGNDKGYDLGCRDTIATMEEEE